MVNIRYDNIYCHIFVKHFPKKQQNTSFVVDYYNVSKIVWNFKNKLLDQSSKAKIKTVRYIVHNTHL